MQSQASWGSVYMLMRSLEAGGWREFHTWWEVLTDIIFIIITITITMIKASWRRDIGGCPNLEGGNRQSLEEHDVREPQGGSLQLTHGCNHQPSDVLVYKGASIVSKFKG